jgi:2-oxoisovalerate ferredoxin oxidoreductase beta subunit
MSTVFYDRFERHSHGQGLKGHATHYCPGCGHGLAHKFLAEAIDELGIQNQTVAISPVGCSVFLYYYFDVGNSQAPHGRAPAVGIGHKLANPESIVISYQGDGDLASIGLAEIVSTAQQGLPITVIFVNNAIYGMTGGQMAPTSLMGMKTATSPHGRDHYMGQPMKMAELIAGLDGPIYVERVALYDAKQRNRAKKAILKGLKLQVEKRGFSFIEVLGECPTHLKMTPEESEMGQGADDTGLPSGREERPQSRALVHASKALFRLGSAPEDRRSHLGCPTTFLPGLPFSPLSEGHLDQARRIRRRRCPDGRDADRPCGNQRGL